MADENRDLLMKLEMTPGKFVPAECAAVIATDDTMASGFKGTTAAGPLIRGNYFSIDDFGFDIGISERGGADQMEAQAEDTRGQIEQVAKQVNRTVDALQTRLRGMEAVLEQIKGGVPRDRAPGGVPPIKADGGGSMAYNRFMIEGRTFLRREKNAYPSDVEPVSITKRMDISSPTLFDCCRSSFKFTSATVLKRKPVGKDALYGFLRLDFYDVMLIDLNWDDDEVTKESFKFVCRKAVVTYSMETPSKSAANKGAAVLTKLPAVEWNVLQTK